MKVGFVSPRYFAIIIILIVSFGVYLNSLSNGFVYDDEAQVLGNPWIRDIRYIPKIFTSDVWAFEGEGATNYYRPLMHIIFMINYHIFGLNPRGFHLINILLHAGVSISIFLITFMLLNRSPTIISNRGNGLPYYNLIPAFISALLFATHTIHTEVVAWVSGIPELSFTFFYILSFFFYLRVDGLWGRGFILSLVFFFLATLCKETALTLPVLLLAYDYSFKKDLSNISSKTFYLLLKRYLPYLIVCGIYFIIRTYAIGGITPLKRHINLSAWQYFINIFPLFIQYLEKLILPINLNAFYTLHPIYSILEWKGIISVTLTVTFILTAYPLRGIERAAFFSIIWIGIPILPVLYIPALGENTFAERYLYLPSVGFVILVSIAIQKIYHLRLLRQATIPVIILILTVVTGLYSIGTVKRNYIWKENLTLFVDTVKKSPDAPLVHNNLGVIYDAKGWVDKAIEHFQIALRLDPNYPKAHYNLGVVYLLAKGWVDKAIEHFQIALRLNPNYPKAHNNLGVAYYAKGWVDKAIEHYQIALRLRPDYPEAQDNIRKILRYRETEGQRQR